MKNNPKNIIYKKVHSFALKTSSMHFSIFELWFPPLFCSCNSRDIQTRSLSHQKTKKGWGTLSGRCNDSFESCTGNNLEVTWEITSSAASWCTRDGWMNKELDRLSTATLLLLNFKTNNHCKGKTFNDLSCYYVPCNSSPFRRKEIKRNAATLGATTKKGKTEY